MPNRLLFFNGRSLRFSLALLSLAALTSCNEEQAPPPISSPTYSPAGNAIVISVRKDRACSLYGLDLASQKATRVIGGNTGCATNPGYSPDGKSIVYALTSGDAGGSVWIADAGGSSSRRLTPEGSSDCCPVFSRDGKTVFFLRSGFFGHHSPIAAPAKHDFDVFSVPVNGGVATAVTQQHLYSVSSLSMSPNGETLLLSTIRYPLGDDLEEYRLDSPTGPHTIFQPHVPGEPASGPTFWRATYSSDGMSILFLAATNKDGGNYKYNLYRMSEVTGADLQEILPEPGATPDSVAAAPDGKKAVMTVGEKIYVVDLDAHSAQSISLPDLKK